MLLSMCFVALGLIATVSGSGGYVSMRLLSISNPGGLRDNDDCCDSGLFSGCSSDCDMKYTVCLDDDLSSNDINSCAYGTTETDYIEDENIIQFSAHIGETANHFQYNFLTWPGSARLKIDVWDRDGLNMNDFVTLLTSSFRQQTGGQSTVLLTNGRISMSVRVSVVCNRNWYGNSCTTYCRPNDGAQGHYTCGPGGMVCMAGWTGPSCTVRSSVASMPCTPDPCLHNGRCSASGLNFVCECTGTGYTGTLCQIPR